MISLRCFGFSVALFSVASIQGEIIAVDDLGAIVSISAPAQRIVSLAPHLTELLFAAGAGGEIVGVVSHSDYPVAALTIPQIGAYNSVSHEPLIALKPDLVFAWNSGNGPELIARLRELGITVYANEPQTMRDVARSLKDFGRLTGHTQIGARAAAAFMTGYEELSARYQARASVEVFYQVWDRPLITMNGKHLISDVIRLCGGRNVFADAVPIAPRISIESVMRLDPEVIVASGMGEVRPDWLDMWTAWPSIAAVAHSQLYFVPPDLLQRHTPRVLDGAKLLCEQIDQARRARAARK
jgi:iron complex transport system substrate-binding protein